MYKKKKLVHIITTDGPAINLIYFSKMDFISIFK